MPRVPIYGSAQEWGGPTFEFSFRTRCHTSLVNAGLFLVATSNQSSWVVAYVVIKDEADKLSSSRGSSNMSPLSSKVGVPPFKALYYHPTRKLMVSHSEHNLPVNPKVSIPPFIANLGEPLGSVVMHLPFKAHLFVAQRWLL